MMQQVEEDGVYIPDSMSHSCEGIHVFAMDNLDWTKKTLEGGSFNATTAIIIENAAQDGSTDHARREEIISTPTASSERKRVLSDVPVAGIRACHISACDRKKARSLGAIEAVGSLETPSDNMADAMLLVWRLGRQIRTSQLLDVPYDGETCLPGFSAFWARLLPHRKASKIGYLPLIPASPTDPAVMKEEMTRLVNTSHALRDEWTVITGDQATYELALAIRQNHRDEFSNVVLLLGGFHQAHNYLKAICKIMRDSGGEDIIASAGLCSDGTANKVFGEKADYYQSMHAIRILSEAVWRLYWEAFESWTAERDTTK